MKVHAVEPHTDTNMLLAGAQFTDAFSMSVDDPALDARHAAARMVYRLPLWITALMALRNILVAPFGLKTPSARRSATADTIGAFPVVSKSPNRVVAGFNDKHLDFRLVVDVAGTGPSRNITATTLVLTHNLLGRVYLAIIMPFHRIIVPAMLRKVAG